MKLRPKKRKTKCSVYNKGLYLYSKFPIIRESKFLFLKKIAKTEKYLY